MKEEPSTTVTSVSSLAIEPSDVPAASLKVNVSATGSGSEMPDDSIKMWSRPSGFDANFAISTNKSSRRVQQMQPLLNATIFSSA